MLVSLSLCTLEGEGGSRFSQVKLITSICKFVLALILAPAYPVGVKSLAAVAGSGCDGPAPVPPPRRCIVASKNVVESYDAAPFGRRKNDNTLCMELDIGYVRR